MRGISSISLALSLGLAAPAPLGQLVSVGKTSTSALALSKAPFTCPAGQIVFQKADGQLLCIAPDANPCPQGQVLDKGTSSRVVTSSSKAAACKPAPAKAPFTCSGAQIIFQKADGNLVCIAPDSNPCPQGQVLDTGVSSRVGGSSPKIASCKGLPAKPPFSCSGGQIAFQRADGNLACIAPDANPCPQGQVLDKTASSGIAACKGLPARTPFACPPGQVISQRPDGKVVCVPAP